LGGAVFGFDALARAVSAAAGNRAPNASATRRRTDSERFGSPLVRDANCEKLLTAEQLQLGDLNVSPCRLRIKDLAEKDDGNLRI
jgi:hypothetical protein